MVNPKLRFKKPDGTAYPDWEEKPLSAIFEEVSEKGYTDLPVLSIVQGKGTIVRDNSDRRISYDKTNVKSYKRVLFGDYIIHLRSFEGGLEMSNHDGIVSPAYHVLRNSGSTIIKPLYRPYFRSFDFITNRLAPSVVGIRDGKSIDMDTFWETTIPYPSVDEQQRMAGFFAAVDEKIDAQEQYVAALETQKKELLRQVFAREIRFKDENGQDYPEWDSKQLEDVVDFLDGKRKPLEAGERISGPYPYYGASGIVDYVEDYLFDEDLILLSEDGANILDRTYRVSFIARGKYWVNNHAHVLKPKEGMVAEFLCEELESFDYTLLNSGSAQPKINQKTCRKIVVTVPSLPEQQRIADFFTALDAQIENERALLEDWRQLKKGLLQQMFV